MNPSPEEFLALDFETACGSRASACSVGYARFEQGKLAEVGETLIDPGLAAEQWDWFNISIHGIEPEDVAGAPSFIEAWSQIQNTFDGLPIVAHNAGFDMSVVRAELCRANVRLQSPIRYACSATLSRAAWPDLLSVSLGVVTDELGIELNHHEAKSDAIASGKVMVEASRVLGSSTVTDALAKAGRTWGQINDDLSWNTGYKSSDLNAKDFAPEEGGKFDVRHPFFGKTVVFTGTLESMTRREAFGTLAEVGSIPGNSVTTKTNLLVVGEQDLEKLAAGETMSSKMKKAAKLRAEGQDIELIGEAEFRSRI
ncbi:MAG: hypothetical protein IPK93_04555 [Solirubrobacterales bacterium]|nr:hypothetical protein [Solirubrobacterales bacterium]